MYIQKTISHSTIYAIGNILRNIAGFLMLPIYTRYLTPADYGTLELLSMVIDLTGLLLGQRISEGIFRQFYLKEDKDYQNNVISTSLILIFVLNFLGMIALLLFANQISIAVLGNSQYSALIMMFSMSLLFGALLEATLVYFRLNQKPWIFVIISVLKLILQLTLNIYFVVFKNMAVEGIIYSTVITNAIFSIILVIYCVFKVGIILKLEIAKSLIAISWPLMVASLVGFYIMYGDRYFIRLYSGLDEVGIYSLAYKFAFIVTYFIWVPFSNIWEAQKYEIYKKPDKYFLYQDIFFLISVLMIVIGLAISLFVDDVLLVMSDEAYYSSSVLVPIIILSQIIQSLTAYCNLGILIKGNTIRITYSMVAAALISTIGFIFIIPYFGALGAAFSVLIAFIVRFFFINYYAKKEFNMLLKWLPVMYLIIYASFIYLLSQLNLDNYMASFIVKLLLFIVFILSLTIMPFIDREYRMTIKSILSKPSYIKKLFLVK